MRSRRSSPALALLTFALALVPIAATAQTAEPVRAQGAWQDSDRMWRGRIMQVLRDLPAVSVTGEGHSTTVSALMRRVQPGEERARVRALLGDLAREGLAWVDGARCGLGVKGAPGP